MKEYWLDLLIVAYAITCIDVILTAQGIFFRGSFEGNPIVTAVVPNGSSFLIPYMTITTILAYWFIFYVLKGNRFRMPNEVYELSSWVLLGACGTHTFGISTWIFV
jgi:hypothetical protein